MKVIVGLGNPGREYAATRHNVVWWLIDHLADVWHFDGWRKDGDARVINGTVGGQKVRVQLYTVPGQVFYDATRKLVLRGADGVVFGSCAVPRM